MNQWALNIALHVYKTISMTLFNSRPSLQTIPTTTAIKSCRTLFYGLPLYHLHEKFMDFLWKPSWYLMSWQISLKQYCMHC